MNERQQRLSCHYSAIGYPIFGPTDYTLVAPISSSLLLTDENVTVASKLFGEDFDRKLRNFVIISWFPGLIFQLACFPVGLLALVGKLSPELGLLTLPGALFPCLLILRSHWAVTAALLARWEPLLVVTYSTIFCISLSYIVHFDLRLSFVWIVVFPTLLSSTIADASSVRLDYAFLKGDLSMTALTLPPYIVSLAYLISIVLLCNEVSRGSPLDTSTVNIRWEIIHSSIKCSYIASSTGCTICLFITKSIIMLFMDSSRCNSLDASMTMDVIKFSKPFKPKSAALQDNERNELPVSTKLRNKINDLRNMENGSNNRAMPTINLENAIDDNEETNFESDDHILEVRFTLKGEVGLDPISRKVTSSSSNNLSPEEAANRSRKMRQMSNKIAVARYNANLKTPLDCNKNTIISPSNLECRRGQQRHKINPESADMITHINGSGIKERGEMCLTKKPKSNRITPKNKSSASVSPCSHALEFDNPNEPEAAISSYYDVRENLMANMIKSQAVPGRSMNKKDIIMEQNNLGTNIAEEVVLTHRQQRLQPFYKLAGAKLFDHHQYTLLSPASSGIIVSDESLTVASELFGEVFDCRLRLFSRYMWYPSQLIQIFCVPIGLLTLLGILDRSAALMTIPGIIFPVIALLRCHWEIFNVLLFDGEQIILNFFSCIFCTSITLIVNWDYRAVYIWTTVFPALFLSAFSDASAARLDHCILGNQHRGSLFRNIFYFALPPYMASLTSIISILFILNMRVTLSFNVLSVLTVRTVVLNTEFSYGVTASSTGFTLCLFLIRYILVISSDPKCCVSLRSRMAVSTVHLDPMPLNQKMRDAGYYVFESHFSFQAGVKGHAATAVTASPRLTDVVMHFHQDEVMIEEDVELAGYPAEAGSPDKRRRSLLSLTPIQKYALSPSPRRRKSYPSSEMPSWC